MVANQSARFEEIPGLPASPNQPFGFVFPKQPFGKIKIVYRSYQKSWFKEWPILHYVEAKDSWFTLLFIKSVSHTQLTLRQICRHNY